MPGPLLCVVGARPNFMKMAPLLRAFAAEALLPPAVLVHTGQHYDHALNDRLFVDLQLPAPDVNLEVGSSSHAVQTAEVMKRFEPVLDAYAPRCVIVVGDVNSTLACSLVAAKKQVPVAHVEAGLRSFDRTMPEEINRVLTDQLADILYTTERSAHDNLAREGIDLSRAAFVGNLMIDSLHAALPRAVTARLVVESSGAAWPSGGSDERYGVVTLHRPSNVDGAEALRSILGALRRISDRLPLVWPMHPRTRASIDRHGLDSMFKDVRLTVIPAQGYLEMVGLMQGATVVLTDSGGVQEETTALGVPCLTLRDNTERPITIEQGTNTLIGTRPEAIIAAVDEILRSGGKRGRVPELWDGKTAGRIARHLAHWLANERVRTSVTSRSKAAA
jgi:UDP-N-acetylglucosamine 2-epimerase (non-hydrolysing)